MAAKKIGRAGDDRPARPVSLKNTSRKDTQVTPAYGLRTSAQQAQQQVEGVTVIGEAVRRVSSETAEFLIEVTSTAPTAAQALRENQSKTLQVIQTIAPAGVQPVDVEAISMKVQNVYAPIAQALPGYGGLPQIGYSGFPSYAGGPASQPETQFGSYMASKTLRINVREPARIGDAADAAARAGATILGAFRLRATDEPAARRAALEAAGKDARMKAEVLAAASGRQVGEPVAISEDLVASNGMYSALRATLPFAFGGGTPEMIGELEYYARVSVNFRLT
jgi:uncharacterized protein YggE